MQGVVLNSGSDGLQRTNAARKAYFLNLHGIPRPRLILCRMKLLRTNNTNKDFRDLIVLLDAHLAVTDEDEHDFYHQYNGLDAIRHVVMLYVEDEPLACGAFKEYSDGVVEIKRMFTAKAARGKGLAVRVLDELEAWATEEGYTKALLETGKRQPYAVRLYEKQGYLTVPNYGQYAGMDNSVCMEKSLGGDNL